MSQPTTSEVSQTDWAGIFALITLLGDLILHIAQASFPSISTQTFDYLAFSAGALYFGKKLSE